MEHKKVRIGILGAARIATKRLIPAIRLAANAEVYAIASRSPEKAAQNAAEHHIPVAHDSYEAMLQDPDIDAIYNPLPNHLHVPWSIKALEADKHVLCEKPIARDFDEAVSLFEAAKKHPSLVLMEAFMYRFHPQWEKTVSLIKEGAIGDLRTVHTHFSYFNDNPDNVRNVARYGGGGLLDIGCYAVSSARLLFGKEPERVSAVWDQDPNFEVDRLASGMLDFGSGYATFHCSTQQFYFQETVVIGTEGMIKLPWPFNPAEEKAASFYLENKDGKREITLPVCNQFSLEVEAFASAIQQTLPTPVSAEESLANLRVLDAVGKAASSGNWELI